MTEDDSRDLTKHNAREVLLGQYAKTFGLTTRQALEDFVAHAENDPESPVFTTAAGPPRKRRRRLLEAAA